MERGETNGKGGGILVLPKVKPFRSFEREAQPSSHKTGGSHRCGWAVMEKGKRTQAYL